MNKRIYSLDSLKFFCIFGVVFVHGTIIGQMYSGLIGKLINTIARTCVPCFFVISGFFFYDNCSNKYAKRYTINLIKILFSWITIYICFNLLLIIMSNFINKRQISYGIYNYLNQFNLSQIYYATGIVGYHLWYLSAMIVVIPILYFIIKKNILNSAIIICLALNIIGIFTTVFTSIPYWIVRDGIFFGLFYCLAGAFTNKHKDKVSNILCRFSNKKLILWIIILYLLMIIERFIYIFVYDSVGDYYVFTIPLTILIFGFFLKNPTLLKNSFTCKLGKHTLGIYLIHPLLIIATNTLLNKFKLSCLSTSVLWQLIYIPILIFISYKLYTLLINVKKKVKTKLYLFYKRSLDKLTLRAN